MLNLAEVKITLGISPELEGFLMSFLEYLTDKETEKKQQERTKSTNWGTMKQQATNTLSTQNYETYIVTLEMLRERVKELITIDRNNREVIEAKFAEYDSSNPTTLNPKYYQEYWMFLNKLQNSQE